MQSTCSPRRCAILAIAVLTCLLALPLAAAAQQTPPAPNPPFINPQLDPPMPSGATDDIAARMAARRALQLPASTAPNSPSVQIPQYTGADPSKIEISDKVITQIIPLQGVRDWQLLTNLEPLLSPNAQLSASNGDLIITDTSAHVRDAVLVASVLDRMARTHSFPANAPNPPTPAEIEAALARRAAQTSPAGSPFPTNAGFVPSPAIVPAPPPAPPGTMIVNYENAPVDTILKDMSRAYGFIVVANVSFPQRITIHVSTPVDADQAIGLLNSALMPLGFAIISSRTDSGPNTQTILRIASLQEMKKAQLPVFQGADPDKIPLTDNLITQVIPLKNISAVRLRNDLLPFISVDTDITVNAESNCILITDTSAKIHRIVSLMATLDKVAGDRPAPPPAPAGRGGISQASDTPFIMTVIDGGAIGQIRHGDILGRVQAPKATLTAPAAGILAKINVHEGQAVKAGDVLFEFDPRAAQADLKAAEARLVALRNQILPPGAPRADIDRNQADIAAADAAVARDRFTLDSLQIRAPIPGTLTTFDFTPGQYLTAGTPLTQIIDTQAEDLTLSFRLAFNDRTRLKIGQKITFTVSDKLPPFPAEITFISPTADDSNRTEIRARLIPPPAPAASAASLIPGVLGTITIPDF